MEFYKAWGRALENLSLWRGAQLSVLILFLFTAYSLIRWPIVALDTDLWYHLSGGRYLFEQKSLPHTSYFSFISPSREWVDYYWLFQALVYKIYSFFDYYGLVFLRAAVYLATISLVWIYLFQKREKDGPFIYLTLIFVLYLLGLLPRSQLVRPHVFSYLFIAAFLYILEFHTRKVFFLPVLAALWSNLHGVEYPVMFLILFAYTLEFLVTRLRKKEHLNKGDIFYIFFLVLSMNAVYFTPHGTKLISVPFISTEFASEYINELRHIKPGDLLSFQAIKLVPAYATISNLLFLLTCIAVGLSIAKREVRVSHLLLFAGGVLLLTKAGRFLYEFSLLALPVLRAHPFRLIPANPGKTAKRTAWAFVLIVLLFSSLLFLKNFFSNPPRYPFSTKILPQGVVTFLNRIPAGGSVLNHPNNGGYLQWMLYPRYKIFLDMEVPFLFKDEDFFLARNVFSDEEILRKVLLKYVPSFITVPIGQKGFKELIRKYPDYAMVFFDFFEVLYINKRHYPKIAAEYELKEIDPFALHGKSFDAHLKPGQKDLFLKELSRLMGVYPDCLFTNQIMARVLIKDGDYRKAITCADAVIRNFPESPIGYLMKADALKELKSYDEAISFYQTAMKHEREPEKDFAQVANRQIGNIYIEKKQYDKAYGFLKKAISVFSPETTYQDLFDLGAAALFADKVKEGTNILRLAYKKLPPDDAQYKERIQKQLALLGIKEED